MAESILIRLVDNCPALEELDVSAIKNVTDELLTHLSIKRPPLRFLNLKACTQRFVVFLSEDKICTDILYSSYRYTLR